MTLETALVLGGDLALDRRREKWLGSFARDGLTRNLQQGLAQRLALDGRLQRLSQGGREIQVPAQALTLRTGVAVGGELGGGRPADEEPLEVPAAHTSPAATMARDAKAPAVPLVS